MTKRKPRAVRRLPSDPMTLAARYQQLILLNRMSGALFADKPFPAALAEACHAAMALMNAQSVSVCLTDELGKPTQVYRHGDKKLSDDTAIAEETALLTRAFVDKRITESAKGSRSWEAAPLLRLTKDKAWITGGMVFGHIKRTPLDADRESALVEISRHFRNAGLIQQTLQQQKISAAVINQSSDAIFVTDLEARVLSWNRGAEELFGWRSDEAVGRHGAFLVPADRQQEVEKLIAEVIAKGRKTSVETVRLRKDGSPIAIEGSFTLLRNDDNSPFAIVRAYRDITKRKEIERLKTEFVALVSHEMRTPLTAIRGFAETIFDYWDELEPEKRKHYLQIILNESKRLAAMATDFLDIGRIETGDFKATVAEVNMRSLCERVTQLFKSHESQPNIAVDIADGAARLDGDEEQLYRLLVNLVSNAVKHSPARSTVTISARPKGNFIELAVSDSGPGISQADQTRLFDKFFRTADTLSKKIPGTGLGLTICKGIVESHGGDIRVESEPGQGARFIARLPKRKNP